MLKKSLAILIFILVCFALKANSMDLTIQFPTIPTPPSVVQAPAPQAFSGTDTDVKVLIKGNMQLEVTCPDGTFDCEREELSPKPDPGVSPNPPEVIQVILYYFLGKQDTLKEKNCTPENPTDCTTIEKINMTKGDTAKCKDEYDGKEYTCYWWKATIPTELTHKLIENDYVSYMIVASDGRGNVLSFLPNISEGPAGIGANWRQKFSTQPIPNMQGVASFDECGNNQNYTVCTKFPNCPDANGLNDPKNDTCGPKQTLESIPNLDILGISYGANADLVYIKNDLVSWNPEGSQFIQIFIDVLMGKDSNIKDTIVEKTFGTIYAPELSGAYAAVALALFDVQCATDPNTQSEEIMSKCRIDDSVSGITVEKTSSSIYFKVNRKGKSNYGNYNLLDISLDSTNKGFERVVAASANVDITGEIIENYFYLVDITPGLAVYEKPKEFKIGPPGVYCPEKIDKVECDTEGKTECAETHGGKVSCNLTWLASKTSGAAYNVYYSAKNDVTTVTKVGDKLSTLSYEHKDLAEDGATYYYWVSAEKSSKECDQGAWVTGQCRTYDVKPPKPASSLKGETPSGFDDKEIVSWEHNGTGTDGKIDYSLTGFYIDYKMATGTEWIRANTEVPVTYVTDTSSYNYTVANLIRKGTYNFRVVTFDVGNNTAISDTLTDTIDDKKSPDQPQNLMLSYNLEASVCGTIFEWNAVEDEDKTATYNIWKCRGTDVGSSPNCVPTQQSNFTKITTSPLTDTSTPSVKYTIADTKLDEYECCYYISSLDEENPANESLIPMQKMAGGTESIMCIECCANPPDTVAPNTPTGLKVTTEPEGKQLKLEWDTVLADSAGNFKDPGSKGGENVLGIEIQRYVIRKGLNESTIDTIVAEEGWRDTTKTSYTVENLVNGTKYYFTIQAVDAKSNKSNPSVSQWGIPQDTIAPNPPSPSNISIDIDTDLGNIKVCWPDIIDNGDRSTYEIYRCDEGTSTAECATEDKYTKITEITTPGKVCHDDDQNLNLQNYYTYCIIPKDPSGNPKDIKNALSDLAANANECKRHVLFSDAPACPNSVTANASTDKKSALVYWDAVTDAGGGTTINGYNICQCDSSNFSNCVVGNPPTCKLDNRKNTSLLPRHDSTNPYKTTESKSGTFYYAVTAINDKDAESPILSCPVASATIVLGCDSGYYTLSGKVETVGGVAIDTKLTVTASFNGSDNISKGGSLSIDGSFQLCVHECVKKTGNCSIVPGGRIIGTTGNTTEVEIYVTNCKGTGFYCNTDETTGGKKKIGKKAVSELPADTTTPVPVTVDKVAKGLCAGDADKSGSVGINDYKILKLNWSKPIQKCNEECTIVGENCPDFDGDEKVGVSDYTILKKNWSASEQ